MRPHSSPHGRTGPEYPVRRRGRSTLAARWPTPRSAAAADAAAAGSGCRGGSRGRSLLFWVGLAALFILLGLYQRLKTLIVMLVVSLFLALAIEPGVNRLVRRGGAGALATGFAILVVTLLVALVFVASIGALVVRQVGQPHRPARPSYLERARDAG